MTTPIFFRHNQRTVKRKFWLKIHIWELSADVIMGGSRMMMVLVWIMLRYILIPTSLTLSRTLSLMVNNLKEFIQIMKNLFMMTGTNLRKSAHYLQKIESRRKKQKTVKFLNIIFINLKLIVESIVDYVWSIKCKVIQTSIQHIRSVTDVLIQSVTVRYELFSCLIIFMLGFSSKLF